MPPVVRVLGSSGSGKTTAIERLVPELTARGLRVGTIKHASHGYDIDRPGSDSDRHVEAGADPVLLVDRVSAVLRRRRDVEVTDQTSPRDLADRWCSDCDLVLAEGFAAVGGPALLVERQGVEPRPIGAGTVVMFRLTDAPTDDVHALDVGDDRTWATVADALEEFAADHTDMALVRVNGSRIPLSADQAEALTAAVRSAVTAVAGPLDDGAAVEVRL